MELEPQQLSLGRRLAAVGSLVGMSFAGVACSPSSEQNSAPSVSDWSIDLPEPYAGTTPPVIETAPGTTLSPYPACIETPTVVLPGDHTYDLISPITDHLPLGTFMDEINAEQPDATPTEFANAYFKKAAGKIGEQLSVVLDDSLIFQEWPDGASTTTITLYDGSIYTEKERVQGELIHDLDTIVSELSRYPDDLFSAFGVKQLRLSDIYTNFGGHYDTSADEISFEFDNGEPANAPWVYTFLAHELAHSYHDKYCGGNLFNDPALSSFNTQPYIGNYTNDDTPEEIDAHNKLVAPELYTYGPAREFVSIYSAGNSAEDFATIVEWTLASRGMIQEGDADYMSPLYYKQQLVVDRLESMIPGARAFMENTSTLLHLNLANESFSDKTIPHVAVSFDELAVEVYGQDYKSIGFNGIRAQPAVYRLPYVSVLPYPPIELRDGSVNISSIEKDGVASYAPLGGTNGYKALAITLFVPKESVVDGVYTGDLIVPIASAIPTVTGINPGKSIDTDNAWNQPLLSSIFKSDTLVPIVVDLTA